MTGDRVEVNFGVSIGLAGAIEGRAIRHGVTLEEAFAAYLQAGLEAERLGKIGPVLK